MSGWYTDARLLYGRSGEAGDDGVSEKIPTLREAIRAIADARDLTLNELAGKLGYKSGTSLMRLMDDPVRDKTLETFEQRVQTELTLSEEELRLVSDGILVKREGPQAWLVRQEVAAFVRGDQREDPGRIEIRGPDGRRYAGLTDYLAGRKELRLTVFNCMDDRVAGELERLLRHTDAVIRNDISLDDRQRRTIYCYRTIAPLMFHRHYEPYVLPEGSPASAPGMTGLSRSDAIVCESVDEEGQTRRELFILVDGAAQALPLPAMEGMDRPKSLVPLKQTWYDCESFADYIGYSQSYYDLEKDHAWWKLKPDIGVDSISGDILARAVREGPIPWEKEYDEVLEVLRVMYNERFANAFGRGKHHFTVMKQSAMKRFVETGRTTDHFWAMRAYTGQERLQILRVLVDKARTDPFVHLLFLKDEGLVRDMEMCYYEDRGLLLLRADTDYDLRADHGQILLRDPAVLESYRSYYMDQIVKRGCLDERESLAVLEKLLATAEAICRKEAHKRTG